MKVLVKEKIADTGVDLLRSKFDVDLGLDMSDEEFRAKLGSYDAILIRHVDDSEIAVLENDYEILHDAKGHRVLQEDYALTVIKKYAKGWGLARKIIFGRTDLQPHRQYIYDDDGKVATDARYAEYKEYDGINFPSRIEIYRPQEEYDITLNMLKVDVNQPLTDEQFTLEQPPGAEVIHLDRPQSSLVAPAIRDANRR